MGMALKSGGMPGQNPEVTPPNMDQQFQFQPGGPYTPRPDLGPNVGFGVGLPQPDMNPNFPQDFGNMFGGLINNVIGLPGTIGQGMIEQNPNDQNAQNLGQLFQGIGQITQPAFGSMVDALKNSKPGDWQPSNDMPAGGYNPDVRDNFTSGLSEQQVRARNNMPGVSDNRYIDPGFVGSIFGNLGQFEKLFGGPSPAVLPQQPVRAPQRPVTRTRPVGGGSARQINAGRSIGPVNPRMINRNFRLR